jgi:hypothetical protein
MKKRFLALAMTVATFGLASQGGTASAFLLGDRSPNVTAGQIIAGGGMTAAYFALTCNNWLPPLRKIRQRAFIEVVRPDHAGLLRAQPDHWRRPRELQ